MVLVKAEFIKIQLVYIAQFNKIPSPERVEASSQILPFGDRAVEIRAGRIGLPA